LAEAIAAPTILGFGALFMCAWNFDFPTGVEHTLWRVAATYTLLYTLIGGTYVQFCLKVLLPRYSKAKKEESNLDDTERGTRLTRLAANLRNTHPSKDPRLDLPLLALGPISVLCALYCLSRGYILVEDFAGLRSLPKSAFETVEWEVYFPHW
jgi:hypothetical protein